jgi:glucokinase
LSGKEGFHIGIDLGGTNMRCGRVENMALTEVFNRKTNATGGADDVYNELVEMVAGMVHPLCLGIGIGVPGLVDLDDGVVYDVVNIPSWQRIELKRMMEEKFHVPVWINNDANCFALGEYHFGKGKGASSLAGLTIGTGLGCGIIIDGKLYPGKNGGAGEFGMIPYKDRVYEYYASGQFFRNVYHTDGEESFAAAKAGDEKAVKQFHELGSHLGNAIKTILYAIDVDRIILGGSVCQAFPFFEQGMWDSIKDFGFRKTLQSLRIEVSELENGGILGAAALCY